MTHIPTAVLHLPESLAGADCRYLAELAVALDAARGAAAILLGYESRAFETHTKAGDEPVTDADRAANTYLVDHIHAAFPQDVILAEESPVPESLSAPPRLWMVDPLDGTKEFIAGNHEYSVMVGLVVHGRPVLGVVVRPHPFYCYLSAEGTGTWKLDAHGAALLRIHPCSTPSEARILVSRSHRGWRIDRLIKELAISRETVHGSLGLKIGLLCEGLGDAYINPTPKAKLWDICGPMALCVEAGGIVTDLAGDPIDFTRLYTETGIVAAHPDLHPKLIAVTAPYLPFRAPHDDYPIQRT